MIAVIGCGNSNRSDDGIGPATIRMLRGRNTELRHTELRLLDAGTDGMAAMFAARGCESLILIDACRSGEPPGTILELPGADLVQAYTPGFNLHDFRWNHALYAGRRIFLDDFPSDVVVLLVEAGDVGLGVDLSPAVASAAAEVVERVIELVRTRSPGITGAVA